MFILSISHLFYTYSTYNVYRYVVACFDFEHMSNKPDFFIVINKMHTMVCVRAVLIADLYSICT